jgi:UDP-3-O-acyl-N-acetylglucosamine deacetylase
MDKKQRTIKTVSSYTGIGLHTGQTSTITFRPAPEDHGIVFVRTDIDPSIEVPALVEYVEPDNGIDSLRGTNLQKEDITIFTVEQTPGRRWKCHAFCQYSVRSRNY